MATLTDFFTPDRMIVGVGLLMILAEIALGVDTGFDLLLLGSILVIGGFVGGFTGNLMVAILTTVVLTILYFWLGRSAIKKKIVVATKATNVDNLIGKTAIVTKAINSHQTGQVKIEAEHWRAASEEKLDVGDKAEIISFEGVTMNVKKSNT